MRDVCNFRVTYNYSNSPFEQLGDEHSTFADERISPALRQQFRDWAVFMHEAFDHLKGFRDEASRQQAVEEYLRLCELLESAGLDFERDEWWNKKPTTSNN